MKRLRNVIGMLAVCGVAAFFTGCGDNNDNNNNSGSTTVAPGDLNGQSYNLSDVGGGVAGSISFANNTYTISQPGATETGTFTATRSGNTWTVNNTTGSEGSQSTSVLTLNFSGSNTGTYSLQRPGQAAINGSFAPLGSSNGSTSGSTSGTTTGTTDGTTTGSTTGTTTSSTTGTTTGSTTGTTTSSTTGTTDGTSTSTGTTTGTTTSSTTGTTTSSTTGTTTSSTTGTTTSTGSTTGTTTGGGTVPAPASLSNVSVHVDQGVLGSGANYIIHLSGGSSGTFNIDSGSVGSGTYTYTPSGNSARLLLNYTGEFQGDFDDMTLFFNAAPGATGNTFSGNQRAGTQSGPMSGTFTY